MYLIVRRNKLYVMFTYELFIFAIVVIVFLIQYDFIHTGSYFLSIGKFFLNFYHWQFYNFEMTKYGSGYFLVGSEQKQSTAVWRESTNSFD